MLLINKLDQVFSKRWSQNLFLVLISVIIYFPALIASRTVNIDAHLIMPLLDTVTGPLHYFHMLINFETYDVQPIRDLTLFIDALIFKNINLNTFIIQNVLYWIIGCLAVRRLLEIIFPMFRTIHSYYLSLLFAVYPLFCATLSWGIARKHVLSFMFIMLTTKYFFKILSDDGNKIKNVALMSLFYFSSIFSQPITLLWPFWAMAFAYLNHPGKLKAIFLHFIPSIVCFMAGTYSNYLYYKNSSVFKLYFESKTSDAFNLSDKILGLGHYIYQLVLPYWPATSYQLGHWSVIAGIFILGIFSLLFVGLNYNRKFLLSWFGFMLFPLAVVLTNAHILSDNYLLTPAFGAFVLVLSFLSREDKKREKFFRLLFIPLFVFWSFYTHKESKLWTDPLKFSEVRNFGRRPNCDSAINLARKFYALEGYLPKKAKDYLESYECFNSTFPVAASAISYIYLQTFILYYENDISYEKRVEALKKLSSIYFFSKLVLATLYIETNREKEGIELIDEVARNYDSIKWSHYYDLIMAKKLEPYCIRIGHIDCLKITSHFSTIPNVSYF